MQVRAGAVPVAAAVLLAACGSSSKTGSSPSGTAQRSATTNSSTTAASGRTLPIPTFALPSKSAGCHGASSAGGSARRISKIGPDVGIVVNVCIEGKGPFPFQLDTGASSSSITTGLADRLKLPKVGKVETISGAGCSATAQERRIASWSVEGIPLHAQTATGQTLPHFGGSGQPDGLIGSDVWSAFGGTRIDFRHGEIVVPGPEGAFPKRETLVKKPVTSPLPGALLHGRPRIVAPMSVDASPAQTLVFVGVAFGSQPKSDFTPDTGASSSAVDTSVARAAPMTPTGIQARSNTACSIITLPKVASGPWSLAGHPLVPQPLVTARLLSSGPAAGLLGADQMNRYGSVIFDYSGGRLVLGAG